MSLVGRYCDCGRPAIVLMQGCPVCARCRSIEQRSRAVRADHAPVRPVRDLPASVLGAACDAWLLSRGIPIREQLHFGTIQL
jgi:hypothetical protein